MEEIIIEKAIENASHTKEYGMFGLAAVGAGTAVYGVYRGVKWGYNKITGKKESEPVKAEPAKAEVTPAKAEPIEATPVKAEPIDVEKALKAQDEKLDRMSAALEQLTQAVHAPVETPKKK